MHVPIYLIVFSIFTVALVAIIAAVTTRQWKRNTSAPKGEPICGRCGYIVRGIATLTCPECGSDLREVGIVTPAMRLRGGLGGKLIAWTILVAIGGFIVSSLVMSFLPRLHYSIDSERYVEASSRAGTRSLDIEIDSRHYVWSTSKQSMQPPMRTIVIVAVGDGSAAGPAKLTIDIDRGTCTLETRGGQQTDLPLDDATMRTWLTSASFSTGDQLAAEAGELLREINRAILANDAALNLTFLSRNRTGSRGGSGQLPAGAPEALAAFWVIVAVTGCIVIHRRHRESGGTTA